MSSSCIHCEGWGCRRCRRDYGEQMPNDVVASIRRLVAGALERPRRARAALKNIEQLLALFPLYGAPRG